MKFCEDCSEEIGTKDGENLCERCERLLDHKRKLARRRSREERESVLHDCGLVKVRGSLGGIYWE